jgi:hypothetical protein
MVGGWGAKRKKKKGNCHDLRGGVLGLLACNRGQAPLLARKPPSLCIELAVPWTTAQPSHHARPNLCKQKLFYMILYTLSIQKTGMHVNPPLKLILLKVLKMKGAWRAMR